MTEKLLMAVLLKPEKVRKQTKSSKFSASHLCVWILVFDVHLHRVSYVVYLFHK